MPQTAGNLLSDPEIANAYEDVREDKSATTWMVLKYISGTSDSLKLDSTGEGDIAEMVEHLGDDEAAYAFVRMTVGNDELSQRVKFVFVSWCGKCFVIPWLFPVVRGLFGKEEVEENVIYACVGAFSRICYRSDLKQSYVVICCDIDTRLTYR